MNIECIMRTSAFIVLFVGLTAFNNKADNNSDLAVGLSLVKDTYIMGEPVGIVAVITNMTGHALQEPNPVFKKSYRETISIAYDDQPTSTPFLDAFSYRCEARDIVSEGIRPVTIGAQEVRRVTYNLLWWRDFNPPPDGRHRLVFYHAGEWTIRFTVALDRVEYMAESKIRITEPDSPADKAAFAWLMESNRIGDIQYLLDEMDIMGLRGYVTFKNLVELERQYPESLYAKLVHSLKVEHDQWKDSVMRKNPDNLFGLARRDLKAIHYDVDGFWKGRPALFKEFQGKEQALMDQHAKGEISYYNLRLRQADLFKYYVTNYSRPLSTEEWQKK